MEGRNSGKGDSLIIYFESGSVSNYNDLYNKINEKAGNLGLSESFYDFEKFGDHFLLRFKGEFQEKNYKGFSALCEYIFSGKEVPEPDYFEGPEDSEKIVERIRDNARVTLDSKV